jgi:hypothetical protein
VSSYRQLVVLGAVLVTFNPQSTNPRSDSTPPPTNFTAIFDAASNEYKTLTKQDLKTHPYAAAFENSNSPDFVMNIFQKPDG